MPGIFKGSILVKIIIGLFGIFKNSYNSSMLKKFADAVYRSWRGSLLHKILSAYVNKKPFFQSSFIYRIVMAVGRLLDIPFSALYRAFKPAVENSKAVDFAKKVVGKDCLSRAYGAGLLFMSVPIGSLIVLILKGDCTPVSLGLCVALFVLGAALSFGAVFNKVIQDSLIVRLVKKIFECLE